MPRAVFLALLAGCGPTISPRMPDSGPYCATTITETVPLDGTFDHYHRDPIEFHLSEPDPTAVVVADFPGVQSTSDDGLVIRYTPTEPLAPNTWYSASLDYCHGTPSIVFGTSNYGLPLEVPVSDLEGTTWAIDVREARFPEGEGIADIVASIFSEVLLVSLAQVDDAGVVLRAAVPAPESDPPVQDVCMRTFDLYAGVLSQAPYFHVAASDLFMDAHHGQLHLRDIELSGTLSPDGSRVGGGVLSVTLDAADLVEVMGMFDEPSLCELAGNLGAPCDACPDGSADTCVKVVVDSIEADVVWGTTLAYVAVADAYDHCPL